MTSRLRMAGVTKTFGRNTVLEDAGVDVLPGEVHALLGQNGSGKSTLIKVLSGLYRPDPGAIVQTDGIDVPQPIDPAQVMRMGLTFIHQSLGLIPGHSVTENVRLATLKRRRFGRFIDWKYEREQAVATLERMNADIDPDRLVDNLQMGQRATVAIARALQIIVPGQGLVVLDESTQSLSRDVLPEFYQTVRGLAAEGTSVLIVSHRLDEVLALADRVTILRDGRLAGAGISTDGMSEAALAREILGRQLVTFDRDAQSLTDIPAPESPSPSIEVRGLTGRLVDHLDFDVAAGEVVGVTGSTESGHEELPYLLTGATTSSRRGGTIDVDGRPRPIAHLTVAGSTASGAALVPADRVGEGVSITESAVDNLTLPRVGRKSRGGLLGRRWQNEEFEQAVGMLKITPNDASLPVSSFSGGNQQKILLAKWLLDHPRLLVLHEPTQAVDVGARADILHAVSAAARRGAAVIVSSIEAQDLSLVCDRVLVLANGRISQELRRPFTPDDILDAIG